MTGLYRRTHDGVDASGNWDATPQPTESGAEPTCPDRGVVCAGGLRQRGIPQDARGGQASRGPGLHLHHPHALNHTIDLAHVLISGWIRNRPVPYTIVGPVQTREFVARLLHAFEFDIKLRRLHERVGDEVMNVEVIEVGDGDTITGDDWQATAIEVDHGYVKPALGFVFQQDSKKLVISGDTTACEAVVKAASGADLLLHELTQGRPAEEPNFGVDAQGRDIGYMPQIRSRIADSHTSPDQLGPLAQEAGVPRLVLSHLSGNFDEPWATGVIKSKYRGELTVGQDLLQFTI